MFWRVRAVLEDRPGALADLASACAARDVNILGLQIFPTTGERVLDELVLRTPERWTSLDVEALCTRAGADQVVAVPCTAKALEDQPVRYLRAAARVLEEPERLEEQIGLLYDDLAPSSGGTLTRLTTDTEQAREVHLRRVAVIAERLRTPAVPVSTIVELRPGTVEDAPALIEMLHRSAGREIAQEAALELLAPPHGESVVLVRGERVIAIGTLTPGEQGLEAFILVEDAEQQHGFGTRIVRALALAVAERGVTSFSVVARPDNRAVVPLINAAGLKARTQPGRTHVRHVVTVQATGPAPARDLAKMGEVTVPLVALLARRPELRDAYPTAGFIDAALREGA